ncbi:50S ribosomal protein L24 [Candidatus Hodgkinia cicadicola]|uniref:50S ribosomal protein L24 n=1 Tax=Candidatus Hodgkinia cicadicola TaxID=573658 RepID=A0ABX4MFZ0_9HYPH|nr:50S ribosomal protein L24 [Candidatus Hodgkinia cicadicola]
MGFKIDSKENNRFLIRNGEFKNGICMVKQICCQRIIAKVITCPSDVR